MKYIKLFENYSTLTIGDNTNYGKIKDETDTQFYFKNDLFPKGSWIHKKLIKIDDTNNENKPLRNRGVISPELVISAFSNPLDYDKIEKYSDVMKDDMLSHNFPPIKGYPIIINDGDIMRFGEFLNGENITTKDIGKYAWIVTDGHHRVFSALKVGLPELKTILDYSYIDDNDFIE